MTKEDAIRMVREVTNTYFPEINKIRLRITFDERTDFYMASGWVPFYYFLIIDKAILKYSETAFKGCLAHELAHIADLSSSNFFQRVKKMKIKEPTQEEREADMLVIEKDWAKNCSNFIKNTIRNMNPTTNRKA